MVTAPDAGSAGAFQVGREGARRARRSDQPIRGILEVLRGPSVASRTAAPSLQTKHDMPLTLNDPFGPYTHPPVVVREIAFGSTEAADTLTHILRDW